MDIRLIIDGGASPQAPPGKITESPPPKEEFEKTLQTAKMEETPGEVAENEPNAQLQTLDSEKEETEAKKPVDSVGTPIQIDPSILAQLQFVGIVPLVESNHIPDAPLGIIKPLGLSAELPVELKIDEKILPQNFVESTTIKMELAPRTEGADPTNFLDATSNQTLSSLITSTFEGKAVVNTPNETVVKVDQSLLPVMGKAPEKPEQAIPVNQKDVLNVTAVQSKSTVPISEAMAPRAAVALTKTEHEAVSPSANVKVADVAETAKGGTVAEVTAEGSAQAFRGGQTKDSGKDEKGREGSQTATPEIQAKPLTNGSVQTDAQPVNSKMTSQERQVMVATIAKKIDELAIKSVRNEVRVEMHPPELGSVIVNIRKDMAGVTATLNASNEPLRQALHDSRNELAGALTDRNFGQVKIEVRGASADTMNMGQQFNQAQSQHHNQNQNQNHHSKQAAQNVTPRSIELKDQIDQPVARRAVTTLLDMEI